MGVNCQICLNKSPNGTFLPGEVISGVIKYAVDEPTEFSRITISLKGNGFVKIVERTKDNKENIYTDSEVYVDEDHIQEDAKIKSESRPHELEFTFNLPTHIPPSYEFWKIFNKTCTVSCKLKYYVRIKFEKAGWFKFAKHFRKEIIVAPGVVPINIEAVVYEEQRKLLQLFTKKPSIVGIKATIVNSVIPIGGKIEINYEVFNDTNIKIKSVKTELVEVHKIKVMGAPTMKSSENVPGTVSNTFAINCGETQSSPLEIFVPSYASSIENSEILSKKYLVRITAELPLPYRNVKLDIPVQIGGLVGKMVLEDNPPPTYWEAMGETKNDNDFYGK